MKYQVRTQDREWLVEIEGESPSYVLHIDGRRILADVSKLGDPSLLSILLDNVSYLAHAVAANDHPGAFEVSIGGKLAQVRVLDELAALAQQMQPAQAQGRVVVQSPMPGLVVDVCVGPGDVVQRGSRLVVVEAMKMQNELTSEVAGTVREVTAQLNQAVESGATLLVIEADATPKA